MKRKMKESTGNKRIDDILVKAREQLEEFGQLHEENCPVNYEDECDCATMDALEKEVRVALESLDKHWLFHLEAHRKHCSPAGNKILTKIKRNQPFQEKTPEGKE